MHAVGLDIGYGNVKLVHGDGATPPKAWLRPAIAVPEDDLNIDSEGRRDYGDAMAVQVNGAKWAAGVRREDTQQAELVTHADRIGAPQYRALYYGALMEIGRREIDLIVTGLPVDQALRAEDVERVRQVMEGEHHVGVDRRTGAPLRTVVRKVLVKPQPVGAYLGAAVEDRDLMKRVLDGRLLVIDPGYYSTDWVVLVNGKTQDKFSGTTRRAVSVVVDTMQRSVSEELGAYVPPERIDRALRNGAIVLHHAGRKVELKAHRDAAVAKVMGGAINDVLQKTRDTSSGERFVDEVLLVGGGAELMEHGLREAVSRFKVPLAVTREPVMAIARGFYHSAALQAKHGQRTAA